MHDSNILQATTMQLCAAFDVSVHAFSIAFLILAGVCLPRRAGE